MAREQGQKRKREPQSVDAIPNENGRDDKRARTEANKKVFHRSASRRSQRLRNRGEATDISSEGASASVPTESQGSAKTQASTELELSKSEAQFGFKTTHPFSAETPASLSVPAIEKPKDMYVALDGSLPNAAPLPSHVQSSLPIKLASPPRSYELSASVAKNPEIKEIANDDLPHHEHVHYGALGHTPSSPKARKRSAPAMSFEVAPMKSKQRKLNGKTHERPQSNRLIDDQAILPGPSVSHAKLDNEGHIHENAQTSERAQSQIHGRGCLQSPGPRLTTEIPLPQDNHMYSEISLRENLETRGNTLLTATSLAFNELVEDFDSLFGMCVLASEEIHKLSSSNPLSPLTAVHRPRPGLGRLYELILCNRPDLPWQLSKVTLVAPGETVSYIFLTALLGSFIFSSILNAPVPWDDERCEVPLDYYRYGMARENAEDRNCLGLNGVAAFAKSLYFFRTSSPAFKKDLATHARNVIGDFYETFQQHFQMMNESQSQSGARQSVREPQFLSSLTTSCMPLFTKAYEIKAKIDASRDDYEVIWPGTNGGFDASFMRNFHNVGDLETGSGLAYVSWPFIRRCTCNGVKLAKPHIVGYARAVPKTKRKDSGTPANDATPDRSSPVRAIETQRSASASDSRKDLDKSHRPSEQLKDDALSGSTNAKGAGSAVAQEERLALMTDAPPASSLPYFSHISCPPPDASEGSDPSHSQASGQEEHNLGHNLDPPNSHDQNKSLDDDSLVGANRGCQLSLAPASAQEQPSIRDAWPHLDVPERSENGKLRPQQDSAEYLEAMSSTASAHEEHHRPSTQASPPPAPQLDSRDPSPVHGSDEGSKTRGSRAFMPEQMSSRDVRRSLTPEQPSTPNVRRSLTPIARPASSPYRPATGLGKDSKTRSSRANPPEAPSSPKTPPLLTPVSKLKTRLPRMLDEPDNSSTTRNDPVSREEPTSIPSTMRLPVPHTRPEFSEPRAMIENDNHSKRKHDAAFTEDQSSVPNTRLSPSPSPRIGRRDFQPPCEPGEGSTKRRMKAFTRCESDIPKYIAPRVGSSHTSTLKHKDLRDGDASRQTPIPTPPALPVNHAAQGTAPSAPTSWLGSVKNFFYWAHD